MSGYTECVCCGEVIMSARYCASCTTAGCVPADDDAGSDCQVPECPECGVRASWMTDRKWHSNCDDDCPNAGKSW